MCQSASFLQTFVTAVETLMEEEESGEKGTFSALDTKLTTLLKDAVGGEPVVDITPSDHDETSNLDILIELNYDFIRSEEINIDLDGVIQDVTGDSELEILGYFAKALIPDSSANAVVSINASLTFTLEVGVEYNKVTKQVAGYLRDSTGAEVTFLATADFNIGAQIGPFPGSVEIDIDVGTLSEPVKLRAGLPDNGTKYYLFGGGNDTKSITDVLNDTDITFTGSITANVWAGIPDIFSEITVNISVPDILAVVENKSAFITTTTFDLPEFPLKVPSLLDILLSDPQGLLDAIDDIFERVEEASLGKKGIVTTFPAPFIEKALGDALGAGTEDNVIANVRRKVVGTLQERLDGYAEPATSLAEVLANEMEYILEDVGLLHPSNGGVTVECFQAFDAANNKHPNVTCDGDNVTSLQWTLNIGQKFVKEFDLDFSLSADSLPLEVELSGGDAPELTIEWWFTLGFGYDEAAGFFLSTFEDTNESELGVEALFSMKDKTLNATLFFLNAELAGLDLNVGAGVYVDVVKADTTNGTSYGRLTRGDLRKLNKAADLFEITAVAGAAIDFNMTVSVVLGDDLKDIEPYIPELQGEIYAQARKEIGIVGGENAAKGTTRKLMKEGDRRRLREAHASNDHPAADIFRWLANPERHLQDACSETDSSTYDFKAGECYKCPVKADETFCARIFDVGLNVESITNAIMPVVTEIVNGEDGYLDKIVKPFTPLDDPIPGLSDLTGSQLSVLGFAKIYDKHSGAETVEKVLKMYDALVAFVDDLGDGVITLAEECDFLNFPSSCCGGPFFENCALRRRSLYLTEDGSLVSRLVSRRLLLNTDNCGDDCDQDICKGTTATAKAAVVKCKASKIEGLSFPFIQDPASCLNLLSGGDIVSYACLG